MRHRLSIGGSESKMMIVLMALLCLQGAEALQISVSVSGNVTAPLAALAHDASSDLHPQAEPTQPWWLLALVVYIASAAVLLSLQVSAEEHVKARIERLGQTTCFKQERGWLEEPPLTDKGS
mmetsp:Transcript_35219/g.64331  ORF Transcript_35219/g.64331 Transcript_35219/m.64331 type:complete len:122 (+) Transcript_35219:49-414(+)